MIPNKSMSNYESSTRHPTSNTATRKARPSKKNQPSNAALDNTGPERGHARSHRSPEDVAKLHQLLNGYNSPDSETGSSEHEEDHQWFLICVFTCKSTNCKNKIEVILLHACKNKGK